MPASHVVVLIPTYNEIENAITMLEALARVARRLDGRRVSMLVVDDDSPDGTGAKVAEYAACNDRVELVTKPKQGLGFAMRVGYRHAIDGMEADVVVTLDCDFQWDPEDIPRLLERIDAGSDVVVGSRHVTGGRLVGWPPARRITHWVANTLFARWVAGTREVLDHNGNFRAIRVAGALDRVPFDSLPRGYAFFNCMIYELSKLGVRFEEVPITFRWRERGETKVSFNPKYIGTFLRDTLEYVLLCFRIRWDRIARCLSIR